MKLALGAAVHAQLDAAVTVSVPVTPTAVTAVGTAPTVIVHDADGDGATVSWEHAAAASAIVADTTEASTRRVSFISPTF